MVTSPLSSPPISKWSSNQQGGSGSGAEGGQLLQELEALSQALYQAGFPSQQNYSPQPQPQPQAAPSPKKHSFLSRRRFSSYEPSKDVSSRNENIIPLPHALAAHDPPRSFSNLLSRHSMSTPQAPPSIQQQKPGAANSRSHFASSTIPSQNPPALGEEKSDIPSRVDRSLSLQRWQHKNLEKSTPEELEQTENFPEVSRNLDFSSTSDKKKSVWSWKPFRALSHIGRQRLHCIFSAYVHAIESLPPAMNGLRLCVHMRKEETKEGAVQTMPSRVFQGIAEFQETLFMKCTLYGGNKGPSNTMKFMAKAFIMSVIAPDIDELDFGKYQLDLSRILADFMDDRKGQLDNGSSWNTVLVLSGKAKGGKLVITFNYEILNKDSASSGNASSRFRDSPPHRSSFHASYGLPNSAHGTPRTASARAYPNHSPSVSKQGNAFDDLFAMEHLNLDEPPPIVGAAFVRGGQTIEVQGFPAFRSQFEQSSAPYQDAFTVFPNFESKLKTLSQIDQDLAPLIPSQSVEKVNLESISRNVDPKSDEDEGSSEDEAEFVVVEQGMEIDKSVENPPNDEVKEQEIDCDEKEYLGNFTPQVVEELVEEFLEESVHEFHEDCEGKSAKEVFDVERDQTSAVEVIGSAVAENEVHEDDTGKIVIVDEGEKKDAVTYQMVIRTLDSLLQGTSAKEQPQEATLEEKVELEPVGGDSLSDEDDATDKKFINASFFPSHLEESKISGTELKADIHEMGKEVEEERGGNKNIDSEVDLVAGEFLDMLDLGNTPLSRNSESEPDSPRAQLLKQFEQEAITQGGFGLDLEVPDIFLDKASSCADVGVASSLTHDSAAKEVDSLHTVEEPANWDNEDDLIFIMEAAKSELQRATQSMQSKTRAKLLEDAETEALMQEWGLNEKAFASSPPKPTFRQQKLPPLGEGLGVMVPLKDGGSLRSMNPSHFQANKTCGKLVMQVSKPVVVPAEMGSGTVDILRNMASMGVENMTLQAMTAMPLEDITGRSVEQVAIEGMTAAKSGHGTLEGSLGSKKELSWNDRKPGHSSQDIIDDFVSLEDLAPMAMQHIEDLAMNGLKIQSDIVEDEASYAFNAFSLEGQPGGKDLSAGNATIKGVTGVHLLKGAKPSAETSGGGGGGGSGLMDMAISLDEWMLLDAGLHDESETKDTMAIMAAHHAIHQNIALAGGGNDEKRKKRQSSRNKGAGWGCMGNTVTIAMLVQLRDPLKNNEAVGVPMMAFVQAERLIKPPKPKVGRNVSIKGNTEDEEADSSPEEPQFKITGVHMTGVKASQEEKKIGWGNQKQQQTGSRWLIANGMSKNTRRHHPLLTSKPSTTSGKAKVNKDESLWSISSRMQGSGSKILKLNPHTKNLDAIYEKGTLQTK